MKKFLSVLLIISMILVNCNLIFAESLNNKIYDESIDDYITIKVLTAKDGLGRVQGLDSLKNVVYDYTCDYKNGFFYDNLNNIAEYFETDYIISRPNSLDEYNFENVKLNLYNSNDIPNYCTGATSVTDSISLKVLLGGTVIGTGLIAIKLAAWIAAISGFSAGSIQAVGGAAISMAASDIYSAITSGDWGKRVRFRINFECSKMWESDPFHPQGGFYFYGTSVKNVDYIGTY